jgi:hypothetical protein
LMRLRDELIERPFAHAFETGGMRRTHLRHHENISRSSSRPDLCANRSIWATANIPIPATVSGACLSVNRHDWWSMALIPSNGLGALHGSGRVRLLYAIGSQDH